MADRYMKIVFTIIACALTAIAVERVIPNARAQGESCGSSTDPCYVTNIICGHGRLTNCWSPE
jgi:hypothetical protein